MAQRQRFQILTARGTAGIIGKEYVVGSSTAVLVLVGYYVRVVVDLHEVRGMYSRVERVELRRARKKMIDKK